VTHALQQAQEGDLYTVTIALGVCAIPVCPQQTSLTPTAMLPASHARLDSIMRSPSIPGLIRHTSARSSLLPSA